ncbi:MAG: EF-hand domain-containing protein [Mariprofundus sp.]|nr:EF-hand domain-containing protein [Mariprofundus sp.]
MKHTSLSIVAALCLSVPAMAYAEEGKVCPTKAKKACNYIENMDANKDGKVSFGEFKEARNAYAQKKFDRMDTNGDGFIGKDDKKMAYKYHAGKFFDKADSNKDGLLSKEEFMAAKKHHRGYSK